MALLEEKGLSPEILEYMKEPLSPSELMDLLDKLDMDARDLVRDKESIWKEEFKDKELEEEEIVLAMIEYPQLMERPILEVGDHAVVGRPTEKLLELL